MLQNKKDKEFLQSYQTWCYYVSEFLDKPRTKHVRLFEFEDPFGPTIIEDNIKTMVVTRETEAADPKIN
jgi:phosphopantetheine adenylyltransferase